MHANTAVQTVIMAKQCRHFSCWVNAFTLYHEGDEIILSADFVQWTLQSKAAARCRETLQSY